MPGPTTPSTFKGYEYVNLSKESNSPVFSFRQDGNTCQRLYSCQWEDALGFATALRGTCKVTGSGASAKYSRETPDNFYFQGGIYPFVCQNITQVKPAGLAVNANGSYDTSSLDADATNIVPADRAHFTVDYAAVRYPLAEDDETNEPVASADGTSTSLAFNEWDRYCEWTREWGVETLTAPIGAYRYVTNNLPLNSYVQFQQQVATVTCKVYGLPSIPPAANEFAGTVNHKAFTIFLDQETTQYTFAAETLLFQPPGIEFGYYADNTVFYNMIYRFIYRPQKHNFFFYYPGGSGSGSGGGAGNRWSWQRIALDTTNSTADGSAPFSLRNFGYLWSPQTP